VDEQDFLRVRTIPMMTVQSSSSCHPVLLGFSSFVVFVTFVVNKAFGSGVADGA
jgi:hypothetical protein